MHWQSRLVPTSSSRRSTISVLCIALSGKNKVLQSPDCPMYCQSVYYAFVGINSHAVQNFGHRFVLLMLIIATEFQQKFFPKPTLLPVLSLLQCWLVVPQNFLGKRCLPATQKQHFSQFCLLYHSTSFPPSFLQESLSRFVICALIWSAIILSNVMCVAISMFQFTFGRRGTSGAMSAGKIKKLFAFVT